MKDIRDDGTPIEVLLVEDNPGDVRLTQEAFREANGAIHLNVATDGVEAMASLLHGVGTIPSNVVNRIR